MARFNPWRHDMPNPLHSLQSELNRLFEEYWAPSRIGPSASPPEDLGRSAWVPAVDLFETPDQIVLIADIPGVDPGAIDLSLTGNVLTLRGEKPVLDAVNQPAHLRERQAGAFHRQIVLSGDVNLEAAQAEARNGVLIVRLPKKEAARPRTIPIQPK